MSCCAKPTGRNKKEQKVRALPRAYTKVSFPRMTPSLLHTSLVINTNLCACDYVVGVNMAAAITYLQTCNLHHAERLCNNAAGQRTTTAAARREAGRYGTLAPIAGRGAAHCFFRVGDAHQCTSINSNIVVRTAWRCIQGVTMQASSGCKQQVKLKHTAIG